MVTFYCVFFILTPYCVNFPPCYLIHSEVFFLSSFDDQLAGHDWGAGLAGDDLVIVATLVKLLALNRYCEHGSWQGINSNKIREDCGQECLHI